MKDRLRKRRVQAATKPRGSVQGQETTDLAVPAGEVIRVGNFPVRGEPTFSSRSRVVRISDVREAFARYRDDLKTVLRFMRGTPASVGAVLDVLDSILLGRLTLFKGEIGNVDVWLAPMLPVWEFALSQKKKRQRGVFVKARKTRSRPALRLNQRIPHR